MELIKFILSGFWVFVGSFLILGLIANFIINLINRILIPSTGYFEYHHEGKETTPYFIFLKDEELFSIGGISDTWKNPETGEEFETFSLITTPANELTGWIHNGGKNPERMPYIIAQELEKAWLNPDATKEELHDLMKVYPAEKMDAYIVKKDFIKRNPKDPEIIEAA